MNEYDIDDMPPDGPEGRAGETMAVQRIEPAPPNVVPITPQDARNTSIAHTLDAAYAKASTLQLTPEESAKLMADFDDSDIRTGARGKENLIYLEHAAVRRRLMEVFGPGGWAIINRRTWLDEGGGWMYADIVLICRGCFVGESIGANRYGRNNAMINYADAVKGAESDALGRIAGTALGVGLQLWSKGFCDAWHSRNRAGAPQTRQNYPPRQSSPPPQQNAPQAKPATTADVLPKGASEKTRDWAWNALTAEFDAEIVSNFANDRQWLDEAGAWKLAHVPTSKQALAALADEIRATLPQEAETTPQSGDDLPKEWADTQFTMPPKGAKRAEWLATGTTLGMMYRGSSEDKRRLHAVAASWNPEPWVDANGKKWPVKQEDFDCRVALDLMLDWKKQRGESDAND